MAFIVMAAVCGVVVWAGAALAAIVTGHAPPDTGLAGAIRAIPGLLRDPGAPIEAWDAGVWVGSPPTVVYWACTGLAAVGLVGVALVGRSLWRQLTPGRKRLGVDARARFATRRELRPLLIREPVPGRFIFGRWGSWMLATENRRWAASQATGWRRWWARVTGEARRGRQGDVTSVAIIGPTRCGKTAECAIPGLLDWEGPVIALSVKRDLMDTTIGRRRQLGDVRVFDPGGFLAVTRDSGVKVPPEELARWSPLRKAHTATGAKKAGEALASWTPKSGVEGGMDFWATQGKLLFAGLCGAAALSPRPSMGEVAEWVFDTVRPDPSGNVPCRPHQIASIAYASGDPEVEEAAAAAIRHLRAIWDKPDERMLSSVYSTAQTVCDPWLDPNVVKATDLDGTGDWIDLDWLMNTGPNGNRANTLYLLVSLDDYQRLSPVLAGLLSDLKAQAYEWEMLGRSLPAPLLMLIDEAGNMPLKWLPEVSSTCAGLGIQLVTVWQSLAQIKESYGERADILLTNHATKLFFPGVSDDSTLSYESKIVGDEEIERRSWSNDGTGRRSVSGSDQRDPLVPYFLGRLPEFGTALLIHSNTPPAHVRGRPWWRDRRLTAMVNDPERHEPRTGEGPWEKTPAKTDRERSGSGEDIERVSDRLSGRPVRPQHEPPRSRCDHRRSPRRTRGAVRCDADRPGVARLPDGGPPVPPLLTQQSTPARAPRRRGVRRVLPELATHPRPGRWHLPGRQGRARTRDPRAAPQRGDRRRRRHR